MTQEEKRALEVARCALSAICDAALLCKTADLQGEAVLDGLRRASFGMLDVIAAIEGTK